MEIDTDAPARDVILVRNLQAGDLEVIVAIDAAAAGRRREQFLALKVKQAFADTGIAVSLVAELDDHVVGFALARVYYGEFGVVEPAAVLDVLGVHPDYRGRRVASALVDQLRTLLPLREPFYALSDLTIQSREEPHDAIVDELVAGLTGKLGIAMERTP